VPPRRRLQAWLEVGTELGALARRGDRYRLRGRRARAIASGDAVLRAHYRSMLGYQAGCYESLTELLLADPGQGRDDLSQHAGDIARVSQAAVPFVGSYLTEVIRAARPRRILDAGCGTGVYSRIAAAAGPDVLVDGIDLSQDVIRTARAQVRAAGLQDRIRLHAADLRSWTPPDGGRYDLVLLLSNLYYFPSEQRTGLLRQLGGMLAGHGQLVVATMTVPGSVAAAHLNFMLTCQQGAAALPRPGEIEAQMRYAGFGTIRASAIVPGEPFAAIRAQIS
jgi:SAM-dependent methyltransferase